MNIDLEDQSVLLRKIEQHRLREQNLSSLPSLEQTSDYEGSDEEEERERIQFIIKQNREKREREENDKENRGDPQDDDLETPVPTRVSKQPIYSQAQKFQRSTTPPFQPTNRILDALRSPSASTASSEQLPSLPNDSGASSNGVPVSSTPAPNRNELRHSNTASTIKPTVDSTSPASQKRFAKSLHHRNDIKVARLSVGSSVNGSFSMATIQHGDVDAAYTENQHTELHSNNSLDLPRLADHDLPGRVQYRDYATPIKGGEDSATLDEPTARRIQNPRGSALNDRAAPMNSRVPDDRCETSLEDQANFDYSERNDSERGQDMSDFTDGEEANGVKEDVVDMVVRMPDETIDSNDSPAPNWVDARQRYRSQSPNLQRFVLPRSPHPRALMASQNGHREQDRIPSLSRSVSDESDRSGASDNVASTPVIDFDEQQFGRSLETPARHGTSKEIPDSAVSIRTTLSELDDVPEEDENSGRYSDGTTPARKTTSNAYTTTPAGAYSPHQSTLSTPGVARNASLMETPLQQTQPPSFNTMIRDQSLRDITYSMQDGRYDSPAPSEYHLGSKAEALQTPKAGEKSRAEFLLSRLESTSKPLRYKAIRGRMSVAGISDSNRYNPAEMSLLGQSIAHVQSAPGDEEFEVGEISGVSVSSSLDLTTDKRMSTARRGRGNLSVPEINLSDGAVQDGVDPSNLVKEMRLINIGLQRENESVNREKENIIRWCKSNGLQIPENLLRDGPGISMSGQDVSTPIDQSEKTELKRQLREAEDDCDQKDDEISQLKERLKVVASLESEVQCLHRDIASKDEQAEEDRVRIADLQHRLEEQDGVAKREEVAMETDFHELEEKIKALTQDKERLTRALDEQAAEEGHSHLQDEIHDLRDELEKNTEQLQEYEQTIRDLQSKLQNAVDENARFVGDAFQAEDAAKYASVTRQNLEANVERQQTANAGLQEEIRALKNTIADMQDRVRHHEETEAETLDRLEELNERIIKLSKEKEDLSSELRTLQSDNDELHQSLDASAEDLQRTENKYLLEIRRANDLQDQLEASGAALQAARSEVQTLERELDGRGDKSIDGDNVRHLSSELSQAQSAVKHLQERLETCEDELASAQHQAANQARQMATIRQKDVKIEALVTEKTALMQRVQILSEQQSNLSVVKDHQTPAKRTSAMAPTTPFSALRPINRVLLNLRTPRTPGQLSEMTWLSGSSIGGGAEEMMMAQLQAMEEELRKANQHIDENFEQLEKRGLLGCSLADELADAHSQIANLKERLQKFRQQHNRAIDQLVATECPGCDLLFDAAEPLRKVAVDNGLDSSDLAGSSSQPDRSRLRQSLATLREQYDGLQREHLKHRERYDAAIKAMNDEIESLVKEKMDVTDQNRKTIIDLENEHVKQIRRLRAEKEELEDERHGMETRLAQIQKELEAEQRKAKALQRDLDTANMRIHGLKTEGSELRNENNSLSSEVSTNQKRLRVAEQTAKESQELKSEIQALQSQYRASQEKTRRTEQERDQLREQLGDLQHSLASAEDMLSKEAKSHDNLRKQLGSLETSLKQHRREAEEFSQALKMMQTQHDTDKHRADRANELHREKEQAMRTIEALERQLTSAESRMNHGSATEQGVSSSSEVGVLRETQSRLISDRKTLTSQVRYLHALYARENTFRDGLLVQKQYLLRLLGKFRQTEQETLALIASMGYPPKTVKSHSRFSFKSVALAVRFTIRMNASRDQWQQVLQKRPERSQRSS